MAQMAHTKKTRLACDSCRRQKRKCDRRTPACLSCEKKNDVCVYDPTFDQRGPEQREYVAALEARVILLEGVLRGLGSPGVTGPSGLTSTDEGDSSQALCAMVPPRTAPTQPEPTTPGYEPGFVPSDDAAQALVSTVHPNLGGIPTTTPEELDLGMGGYLPLVSLDMEHKLLAQFWVWQRTHIPYVAPVPFLSAYALYAARVAHPDVPASPASPPPPNLLACSSAAEIPSVKSVYATPGLAQFISPLLLDAMFVIGALFHGDAKLSNQFNKRAESRLMDEAANPRLATVQGVMLMAITEFGRARAPSAWTLNGVTVALCVRLGMHVDATPLVRDGNMSKTLFETRNFVFWTICHNDRSYALCLGVHPLLDRRIISTPRRSSLAAANVGKPAHAGPDAFVAGSSSTPAEKPTVPNVSTIWQGPMGDVFVQAGWEALRDLARIMDTLFDGIYAFDAPKRTPQEDLELVARNNLTIQRFLDGLPTYLRSTDTTRTKSTALVYLHSGIHISIILMCRPFLSPRPLSEAAMRTDATTDISQPTHSSHVIRRYRTLAFRIARASALQIASLVRCIPLSSPCVTTPYVVHTACTILLLAPSDTAAMEGVRMGLACLKSMQDTGHWAASMKDGREGVLALANRWDVDIERGKKLPGLALRGHKGGRGGAGGGKEPGVGEVNGDGSTSDSNAEPVGARSSDIGGVQRFPRSSNGTRPNSVSESGNESASITRLSASTVTLDETAEPGATRDQEHPDLTQEYEDNHLTWIYAYPKYLEGAVPASNYGYTGSLPQGSHSTANSDARCIAVAHNYDVQEHAGNQYSHASGPVYADESANGPTYAPPQQYHSTTPFRFDNHSCSVQYHDSGRTNPGVVAYERQALLFSKTRQQVYPPKLQRQQQHRQPSSKPRQQSQYRPYFQHPLQKPQPQPHSPAHHHRKPASPTFLPGVTYTISRTQPQRDPHIPQTHWHQILPPAHTNPSFPPDSVVCTDPTARFANTVQTTQEPAFLRSMEDPRAGVAREWLADVGYDFPATTMDTYAGLGVAGSHLVSDVATGTLLNGGMSGMYAQGAESEGYRHEHSGVRYAVEGSVSSWIT